MKRICLVSLIVLFVFSGCNETREKSKAPGMKCGAGKCGANMFDGNSALVKKKKNILSQMRKDESRRECVINAVTTKATYDCVRESNGKKLTVKCGVSKCGDEMTTSNKNTPMKCGTGKCGGSM